jgi:hypothetical protein
MLGGDATGRLRVYLRPSRQHFHYPKLSISIKKTVAENVMAAEI